MTLGISAEEQERRVAMAHVKVELSEALHKLDNIEDMMEVVADLQLGLVRMLRRALEEHDCQDGS